MDAVSTCLGNLLASLSARLPGRLVTDEFLDHPARKLAMLELGVVTILLSEVVPVDDWTAWLRIKIVGQLALSERTHTPADMQRAEIAISQQIYAALRNPGADLPLLTIEKTQFSRQLEHPFGWVAIDIRTGEIELATGDDAIDYPPTIQAGDFKHLHVDMDIEPFASAAVHQQWVNEEPAPEQPDLTATVELQS